MPRFAIEYDMVETFVVHVDAENEQEAAQMLLDSASPTTDVGGFEPDWVQGDLGGYGVFPA